MSIIEEYWRNMRLGPYLQNINIAPRGFRYNMGISLNIIKMTPSHDLGIYTLIFLDV